jgi:hypothetical protein
MLKITAGFLATPTKQENFNHVNDNSATSVNLCYAKT